MSQPDYNVTMFGSGATSSGFVNIKSGPTILHSINVTSSGTGGVTFYASTTTSTGNEIAVINSGITNSYVFDVVLSGGLSRTCSSSTAEMSVTWA